MVDKWVHLNEKGIKRKDRCEKSPRIVPTEQGMESVKQKEGVPIDFERAIGEFLGEKEELMEILDTFIKYVKTQIETMRQAISEGDAEVVMREAHSIKGGAANLTADRLSDIAFELEKISISGAPGKGNQVLDVLAKELEWLENFTKEMYVNR